MHHHHLEQQRGGSKATRPADQANSLIITPVYLPSLMPLRLCSTGATHSSKKKPSLLAPVTSPSTRCIKRTLRCSRQLFSADPLARAGLAAEMQSWLRTMEKVGQREEKDRGEIVVGRKDGQTHRS